MEQTYESYGKETDPLNNSQAKYMGLDEKLSRKIFATDGGCVVNAIAYFSSSIFMEEVCIITIIGLHFSMFKTTQMTIGYVACFAMNLLVALVAKKLIAKPRPNPSEIPETSKSMFFRKKQSFNASSPSGDTVQSTNLVMFAALCLPSWAFWSVLPIGLLVPASRVYLCCHWISDTLAGICFGSAVTYVTVTALRHWTSLQI